MVSGIVKLQTAAFLVAVKDNVSLGNTLGMCSLVCATFNNLIQEYIRYVLILHVCTCRKETLVIFQIKNKKEKLTLPLLLRAVWTEGHLSLSNVLALALCYWQEKRHNTKKALTKKHVINMSTTFCRRATVGIFKPDCAVVKSREKARTWTQPVAKFIACECCKRIFKMKRLKW